jgi:hypothetical protein
VTDSPTVARLRAWLTDIHQALTVEDITNVLKELGEGKVCRTCLYWDDGRCEAVDYRLDKSKGQRRRFDVVARADDDSGLVTELRTGPEFGCAHHEPK